ncbi:MAG TPA: ABC transporter permease [Mycobacteriales bacterium]|nr:ABC transporter permease [Mycobacteriales bacterium]
MRVLPWELRKLLAQTRVRIAFLTCLFGPPLLALVLGLQDGLPKDTLFGRHVHASGYALPLVVLGFASVWAFPLLTSLVAGDVFSSEDAHGTWPSLLTRSRSRSQVFTGKVLASVLSALALLVTSAVSSLLAGLALAGSSPLVDLSGRELAPGRAAVLVLLSWMTAVPPLLAFTALACLLSVATRSSVVGVGGPVLVGLLMQLLSLVGALGSSANALLTTPFLAWRGLVRDDPYYGPLWQGALVCLAWSAVCLVLARVVLLRRDVT